MLPVPDTVFYLSKVSYLEEKGLIVVEFSNAHSKQSMSFRFFPSVLLPVSKTTEPIIKQLVNTFDRTKFKAEKKADSTLTIFARTFTNLKCFCNILNTSLKMHPLLLKPEKQFLLLRNWGYFDAFRVSFNGPEKQESFELPQVQFDWLGGELEKEISLLLKKEPGVAEKILESTALSNVLCIPLHELPQQKSLVAELFLEAACFRNAFAFGLEKSQGFSCNRFGFFNGDQSGFAELDFSKVWPALFGSAFFNLSLETVDCDCCIPETAFEPNILPSSLVEVRFKKDGFFFESKLESFSQRFHETSSGKESRLLRQKEFFLQSIPTGPFNMNDTAIIPIEDAIRLEKENSAAIVDATSELHWFCRKREGLLSKELGNLNRKIVALSKRLEEERKTALKQHGVFAENALSSNAHAMFLQKSIEALSSLSESIPVHLLSPNSRFFDKDLSSAFIAIQSIILKNFRQFSNSKGAKAVAVSSHSCLLSREQALSISKEFSNSAKLPMPAIR